MARPAGYRLSVQDDFRGLSCILRGGRLRIFVPGRQVASAASTAMAAYLERCVARLMADPGLHEYDPVLEHCFLVELWDRARSGFRSLAMGRTVGCMEPVQLMPDLYFIGGDGYRRLRSTVASGGIPPWRARDPVVLWRGSVTGTGAFSTPEDIPRVALARRSLSLAHADVGLIGVHPTMAHKMNVADIESTIDRLGLRRDRLVMERFGQARFSIDIDGHANAWGLLEKLILGCCVLKVATPYEQWFYSRLVAWEHYVPLAADLSDLEERIAWCLAHDAACERIAHNGAALAETITMEAGLDVTCRGIVTASAH